MKDITDRGTLTREDRSYQIADLEVRQADDGNVTFEGVASTVDSPYTVRDMFGEFSETVARGAFNRTIKQKDDVRLLVNHEGVPLARTKSKTLSLTADPHLRSSATLDPANPTVQEIRSAMSRGDLDQMSIGFRVRDDEWNDDYSERVIREVELFDVSVVTYPANPTTTASIRSIDDLVRHIDSGDFDEAELRRLIAKAEARGLFHDDLRARLRAALTERFPTSGDQWVWIRDFSDDQVIFELDGYPDPGTFSLGYTLDSDESVVLSADEPVKVEPMTTYEPVRSDSSMHPELVKALHSVDSQVAAWRAEGLLTL